MSKFIKINHIKNNKIEKIYILLNGDWEKSESGPKLSNGEKIFTDLELINIKTNNIEYEIIKKNIHNDDTILRIKEKILQYTELELSTSEMYLFTINKIKISPNNIYNKLTKDETIELTYESLCVFLSNILIEDGNLDIDINNYIKDKKDRYDYNDFLNLNIIWENDLLMMQMLGQKILFKNNIYTVNPYNVKILDNIIYKEGGNIVSTQNKYLLFEYGELWNNNIYLCDAENVINYSNNMFKKEDYLLKLYYKRLFNTDKINNLEKLERKKYKLLDKDDKRLSKTFEGYNKSIDFFYEINNLYKDQIKYISLG